MLESTDIITCRIYRSLSFKKAIDLVGSKLVMFESISLIQPLKL